MTKHTCLSTTMGGERWCEWGGQTDTQTQRWRDRHTHRDGGTDRQTHRDEGQTDRHTEMEGQMHTGPQHVLFAGKLPHASAYSFSYGISLQMAASPGWGPASTRHHEGCPGPRPRGPEADLRGSPFRRELSAEGRNFARRPREKRPGRCSPSW